MIKISIDAMGGDFGPEVVIPGAAKALERHPDIRFIFFGLAGQVEPVLARYPKLQAASEFRASQVAVKMDDKPSQALRSGRGKSSMWQAIEAVKTGDADVCVSAGNTGALMAMSKFCLRMLSDVERPAIAAIWPTLRGESVVLDVGATIGADARQLVDYAVMGAGMARALFEIRKPTVGLLNVGTEEVKGLDEIKEAAQILRDTPLEGLQYTGFVEGNDIGKGTVDVVVTEGFTGNVSLKTAEGTARQMATLLRQAMTRTWLAKIGYIFAKGAFDRVREKMDPNKVNGGVLLGMSGVVIKSHGGATAEGFCSAVEVGYDMVRNKLLEKIEADLAHFHHSHPHAASSDGSEAAK
ncbi:phosphate acyltransferase PlsX [Brucella rhizosphaerae]|uniref:Phosphate acyltransferase n=1 Tax=Brucella rhizosphaerae TaxID=571254 RepID=A0A256FHK0_9HYPH|nr:phosphate acyltransferase PlsX [Brucella rhizosphaerae]OYR14136.1 fatty acid/phospholipid synthesis protein PlsX [Brucella rhizosphaerae]